MTLLDVSWPLTNQIATYPGNVEVELRDFLTIKQHGARVSLMKLGSHTGTHYDAPNHFIEGASGVEAIPLEATVGPCRVLDLSRVRQHVTRADLETADPRPGQRLLLKTRNSGFPDAGFRKDFAGLTEDAAQFLVERRVRLVGVDYLSIEPYGLPEPVVHMALLRGGVNILEGLRLAKARPATYRLHAPPLLFPGGDGAPARAILEPEVLA